jgi:hypothetical protein
MFSQYVTIAMYFQYATIAMYSQYNHLQLNSTSPPPPKLKQETNKHSDWKRSWAILHSKKLKFKKLLNHLGTDWAEFF